MFYLQNSAFNRVIEGKALKSWKIYSALDENLIGSKDKIIKLVPAVRKMREVGPGHRAARGLLQPQATPDPRSRFPRS